ncbi:M23 family metallopeptidase [Sulfurimonas sp. SAG-AH-194-C21]|nr:M23 family metallopeptidase [Sulfurimonas sp. SAG-AH-194-C21]MDF1883829.1 M23 family metallopeptidase [Sulfurimonas sp. SAG-AH-194-C21]
MRKKNNSSLGTLLVMVLVIAGTLFIYFSSMFERNVPLVTMQESGFWNLKQALHVKIKDESGVKSYKITLKSADKEKTLQYEQLINPEQLLNLEVQPPRSTYAMKDKEIQIIVEANDVSKWNFLNGNAVKQVFTFKIDKKRPRLSIVSNSYKISRGGSALVIFKVEDDNLDTLYIQGNDDKHFTAQPFYKDGYFISLLAWPVVDSGFKATVIAKDKAGNVSKTYIPLYLKQKNYKISRIRLSDKFLKGKIADLAEEFVETQGVDGSLEQFKIINEDVRAKNEALIHEITSKVHTKKINNFKMNKMYPLKNAQVVATFGDHRKYSYGGEYISESYHLGLDLASNAMASIKPQNSGEVVFSDYNGLYGNMPLIHHGLGLYTLYGHCSSIKVNSGDTTIKKEVIANTGKSGYAMGDHLHFGVLVQGIEVRPQEWMDKQWIKLNITNIIKSAKKIIDRN